jgi:hypothetical protein
MEWTITIKDTGERIEGICGEHRIVEKYDMASSQHLPYADRDEAIGAVFAWLADVFEK